MKRYLLLLAVAASLNVFAQKADFDSKEVERIESFLASDEMKGRRVGSPEIDKAANFIADEFRKAGLQGWKDNKFSQPFGYVRPKMKEIKLKVDDADVDMKNIVVITPMAELKIDEKSGYDWSSIKAGDNLMEKANQIITGKKNMLVMVDSSFAKTFPRLTRFKRQLAKNSPNIVFILGDKVPTNFKIKADHELEEIAFANVVGILPGKSKKNEYVIFSGHYDHVGIGKPINGDSIYNGANDDAAGITAVIMLANYFKKLGNNERTLVFAAFTAEEIGLVGSTYFSEQMDPRQVVAMFNIEMIGTESKWGKNSAYITGYDKSDMGRILMKNLKGTEFTFYADPYTEMQLFYRSDNATLAKLGVPAHTISTAKMEQEPHYHKPSDEVSTLDLNNMLEIIRSIALSSRSIVEGKDTPSRVKPEM
jgi:hypothetical protein